MFYDPVKLELMLSQSIGALSQLKAKSFSISTIIPKKWLITEEENWDSDIDYESVKTSLNKAIVSAVLKATGMDYSVNDSEVRITYNMKNYAFEINNEPLFIFGRYMKYSRELSQTRWDCRHCRGKGCIKCGGKGKMYVSVEELIGDKMKELTGCSSYVMHASGREDIDVECHAGRPFVMEMNNPKAREIGAETLDLGQVKVKDLRKVKRDWVELVSTSHFNKTYRAAVELDRKIGREKIKGLENLAGTVLEQETPERVAHRRAALTRRRKVLGVTIEKITDNGFECLISAESGTYIKELISGDGGRTKPNFSELLGSRAGCVNLIVERIDDEFLNQV